MTNSLNQNAINQVYLSNSTERFVVSDSGDYYWWNDFNRSYQPIDTSSLPGQIIGVDSDNAGNLAFLTSGEQTSTGSRLYVQWLTTWNASSQSLGESEVVTQTYVNVFINPSFAYISSTELLLVSDGELLQYTWSDDFDLWYPTELGDNFNFVTAVVGLDGSAWALDDKGQAWIIDGTQVSLFNGSNNPPLKQLSVVDSNRIYGLGTDGNVYQWSIAANSFIDISNFLSEPPPSLAQIQVDEQGILYGISTQNQGYQLFDTNSVVDISNPNTQPSGLTTITDNSGVTHAVWNENGQIYYGYQQAGGNGQYIGVAPLSSGIGTPTQGSSTDLNLINSSGTIQAYWINNDGNDTEVYSSNLSPSPYGGYQWSNPQNLTNNDLADNNLEVTTLDNNQVLITTQKQGVTSHQVVYTNQLTSTSFNNKALPFRPKGQGFVYDLDTAPDNSSLLGGAQGLPLPKDFSISLTKKNKTNDVNSTTTSISATISGSVDQQYISQAGQTVFVPSNSIQIAAGIDWVNTLQPYIQNKLNFSLQSGAKWPGIQAYPGATSFTAGVGYELNVETLGFILDKIAPGVGVAFEELNASGVLQLKLEALVALGISVSLLHLDSTSNGDDDYFFELVNSSLEGANANTPESELFWEFQPQKMLGYLEDVFKDPDVNVSFTLSTGLALTAKLLDFIKTKIKTTQTEVITRTPSDFNLKTTFTYKWNVGVDLWLFSIDWGGGNSVVEYNKKIPASTFGDSLGFLPPNFGQTTTTVVPGATSIRRVNYEPKSTTHLLASSGLSAESATDLVDSADIAYVIQGNTAYGTFAAAVNDNSDNFTYLYFVQGTVTTVNNQTTIAWSPTKTLQVIPNTPGANQRPEIAIDSAGNVMITWQYESITNPTVAAIATTPPGQVYLVYGQAGNNPINLSSLGENPSSSGAGFYWTLDNEYFASLGQAVTALGDVNGGGKADFAMTAPDLNDEQGGVYVVFGEQYSQVNDLNNLGSNGLLLTGQALSELGYSIANAGDVNGDGKSDLIIGAPGLNNNQGAAYLLYGGTLFETPQTITDIDTLLQNNPTYGQQITNPNGQAGDRFGTSVTGGQDFNGDGKADFAVSAPSANQEAGEITLILSQFVTDNVFLLSVDNQGNLVLTNQTTNLEIWNSNTAHLVPDPEYATGYLATMEENGNFTLSWIAGDAVISYWSTGTGGNPGAYLALGTDGGLYIRNQQGANIYTFHPGSNLNNPIVSRLTTGNNISSNDPNSSLTSPNTPGGTITLTNATSAVNGNPLLDIGAIALIPDVNQDGKADLLIGGTGAAVILFGSNLSTQTLDLATINPGQGFVLLDDTGIYLPLQVSSAGDVNGDGINDIIVGQPAGQDAQGQPFTGNAYVLFGGSNLSTGANNTLGLSALNGTNGFTIVGAGTEVIGAGDINGDGVADLIVSEPDAQNQSGVSYVIYGGQTNQIGSVASINVSQVGTTVNGYVIGQANANQLSGSSLSPIGDINGDGKIDLLVGAPNTIPSADLTTLQNTIAAKYITGKLNGGQVSFNNPTPAPIPNLAPGQALQSLTTTPFGILGILVSGNNLLASFWQAGTGWQGFQTIATLTDSDGTFTDIAVNAGNPVTVSWGATDGETSTTVLNQSVYNGRGWNNTGFATSTSPAPTADIDNIITQSGNTAQFSVLHQSAKESDGKVVFTVTRQGDMSQPVTLNYRTEDITATATADYQHSEGTITFAPGETTKSIEILVYEDTLDEHLNEKFQLILTPMSSSLAPFSATATLSDTSPTINLLAIDSGFQMVGPANALLTYAISGAGDVDGDGYGEFLISAPGDNSSQGKIYLIAGVQGIEVLNQGLNVDSLSSVQGLSITGVANATTQAGYTLSNWDNYYALSAPNLSLGASGTSSIYVFQKTTLNQYFKKQTSVDITSLDSSPLTGDSANAFGKNVLLYDLNKDGTPELIVSSPLSNQVLIYTLSGNSKTLQATLTVSGNQSLGSALQVLDLDGDGNLDIVMGASTANPINDSAGNLAGYGGAIYILKGTGSLPQNTTLTNSTSSVNWVFNGASNLTGQGNNGSLNPSTGEASSNQQTSTPFYDRVGNALAVLDLNGDGHQDLAIGAPNAAVGSGYTATANLGKAYVLFGNQNPSLSNLSQIGTGQGVTFQGVLASGQAGWEVANGQDINKDGIADLLIGAPFAYGNAGSAYVAFGSTNAYTNNSTVQLDPNVSNSRVFQYQGVANPLGGNNVFNPGSVGQSLGGVGDINGDYNSATGGDDIIIGAPSSNNGNNQGQIYAAIGHPWLQGGLSLNVSDLRGDNGFIELNAHPALGVGDVNGDGYADFINTNGQLTLGASTLSNVSQQRTFTLAGTLQNNPAFFTNGDFNADGYQDIVAVGTLNGQTGLITYTGGGVTQNILAGQFLASPLSNLIQTTTGDVNGDAYEDLLVLSSVTQGGQGQIAIYSGSASGLSISPSIHTINDPNISAVGDAFGDAFDNAIHAADINGDGIDEIFVYASNNIYNYPSVWTYQNNNFSFVSTGLQPQSLGVGDDLGTPAQVGISSGDVNGDGNQDILVSYRADIPYPNYNVFWANLIDYVFYGNQTLSQFGTSIDTLTNLTSGGNQAEYTSVNNSAQLSTVVGDINADGFDDILVNQFTSSNQANVHLGSATNPLNTTVPIQGLPNRQTLYQTGQAGDINGDGYDDFLIADQDYKLTYAIYGQDWEPQTATWNSNVTVQPMEGTNGNDVFQSNPSGNFLLSINGQNGDDYVNTPIFSDSQTQLFLFKGGQGDDQFGLPATDSSYIAHIDGGSGYDTLFIQEVAGPANSIDLTKLYQKISNIEEIDLGYDDSVIFDLNSLLQILDSNKTLIINGVNSFAKPSDQNNSNWSQMGEDTYNGKIYQIYSYANTAVEVWIQKGGVTWTPSSISLQQSLSSYQGIFLLNGNQLNLLTNLISTNTSNVNELGVFKVDNDQGYINGLAPDSSDYLKAALGRDRTQVLFSAISDRPNGFTVEQIQRVLDLSLDHKFGFYVIENNTTDTVQNQLKETGETNIPIFLSTSPNLTISESTGGRYQLDWSDSAIGSEGANSLIVETQGSQEKLVEGSQLQGNAQSEVLDLRKLKGTVNIEASLYREAGYNNTVGFYAVDLEGKVVDPLTGLAVTDSPTKDNAQDYLQKALQYRANIALSVENQATVTQVTQLQGGLLYAPFLIQDGSFLLLGDDDLSNDPQVFFPYLGVNSDKVDHLRLLGNNLFGFEDLTGGGDLDYNDVIVKVNLLV